MGHDSKRLDKLSNIHYIRDVDFKNSIFVAFQCWNTYTNVYGFTKGIFSREVNSRGRKLLNLICEIGEQVFVLIGSVHQILA